MRRHKQTRVARVHACSPAYSAPETTGLGGLLLATPVTAVKRWARLNATGQMLREYKHYSCVDVGQDLIIMRGVPGSRFEAGTRFDLPLLGVKNAGFQVHEVTHIDRLQEHNLRNTATTTKRQQSSNTRTSDSPGRANIWLNNPRKIPVGAFVG